MNPRPDNVFSTNSVLPPSNIEAEQALIGCVLMNNEVFAGVAPLVNADSFYEGVHAKIWDVAATLIAEKKTASPLTLKAYLADVDLGPDMTVAQYLARLAGAAIRDPSAATSFASVIADLANRRRMIEAGHKLIADAAQPHPGVKASHIAGEAISALTGTIQAGAKKTQSHIGEAATDIIASAKRIIAGEEQQRTVTTGIHDLDRATGGYQPGDLWLVAGRPGMGKSGFLVSTARKAAQTGAGVLVFELELPLKQITARFLAESAYLARKPLSYGEIMRAQIDDEQMWMIEAAQKRLDALPLMLDTAPKLRIDELVARVRSQKAAMAKRGIRLDLVLIDQLDYVKALNSYNGNKVHQIGEVSQELKTLAKEEDLCTVLFTQLNRGVESRDDKRPNLADLRDSGNLEQDADVVAFLYRESYYLERSTEFRNGNDEAVARSVDVKNKLEFILGKNRTGMTRTLDLFCDIGSSVITAARG
jgi:replicative DNA helicase